MTGQGTDDGAPGPPDDRSRSIELTFDEAADAQIRADWEALAAAGLSSLAPHTAPSNAPHLTLLERPYPLPDGLAIDTTALPLPLVLGPPVLLGRGDRRVLARTVIPTAGLLELRAVVLAAVGPDSQVAPHADASRPSRREHPWLPHVTLARRLRVDDIATALGLLGEPVEATGTTLRAWDPATSSVTILAEV